jgi:hypothetical protein
MRASTGTKRQGKYPARVLLRLLAGEYALLFYYRMATMRIARVNA